MKISLEASARLILAVMLLLFILVLLFFPLPGKCKEPNNQIVLEYQSSVSDLRFFIPKGKIAYGLIPLDNYAPMNPGTLSVCKVELVKIGTKTLDGKEHGDLNEILFRCGQDKYLFTSLATVVEK